MVRVHIKLRKDLNNQGLHLTIKLTDLFMHYFVIQKTNKIILFYHLLVNIQNKILHHMVLKHQVYF